MVIDQAIVDRAGRILISRNTMLDSYHIMSLVKMGVPGVYIREGEEDEEPQDAKEKDVVIASRCRKK